MDFHEIQTEKEKLKIKEALALEQALTSKDVDSIHKAQNYLKLQIQNQSNFPKPDIGKSILVDPFYANQSNGYLEKRSTVNWNVLRAMSYTPIPRAIIHTRKTQISEFCVPQDKKGAVGFVIRKKKKSYFNSEEDKVSKAEQKEIDELTEFVLNCGDKSNKWHEDDFDGFVRQFMEDSLALDQAVFEPVYARGGEIVEFFATDGGTYRLIDEREDLPKVKGYNPKYVQVIDGQPVNYFYPWELCFGLRNPQTDIRTMGYGRSELEDLINTVTDLLNASSYNSNYFRIGSNPKGILRVKNLNTNRIDEFRQNWLAEMAGVKNAHKLPIVDADTMDFINTQTSNKDMEYHKYIEFLIKISCAIYKISPEEIGFTLEGTGTGGLGNGDNETELEYSKSKGLYPLLRFLEAKINRFIIGPKTEDKYELKFTGFGSKTEAQELEEDIKKVKEGGMAMQDFFQKYSGRELEDEDIILNPIYLQYKQMAMMGDQQSNEFVDDEFGGEEEDDNPFLQKAVNFVDKELNNK